MGTISRKIKMTFDIHSTLTSARLNFCVAAILILTLTGINVAFANLPVTVTDKLFRGDNATFSCTLTAGTLRQLTWSKTGLEETSPSSEFILQHIMGDPLSYGSGVDSTRYEFNEASNEMTVLSVTLDDEGRYWCQAKTAEFADVVNSTNAAVAVSPAVDATEITYEGGTYKSGDTIDVYAGMRTFTCTTNGTKPAATFTWTPSTSDETTTSVTSKVDSRLFDSSSNVTVDIGSSLSFKQLKCKASNTDDESLDVEIKVNLTLNVGNSAGGLSLVWKIVIGVCVAAVIILGE